MTLAMPEGCLWERHRHHHLGSSLPSVREPPSLLRALWGHRLRQALTLRRLALAHSPPAPQGALGLGLHQVGLVCSCLACGRSRPLDRQGQQGQQERQERQERPEVPERPLRLASRWHLRLDRLAWHQVLRPERPWERLEHPEHRERPEHREHHLGPWHLAQQLRLLRC